MCKSKKCSMGGRFPNRLCCTIIFLSALCVAVATRAQDQCAAELEEARLKLNAGLFSEVVELAGRCLNKSGLTAGEKTKAYWFTIMAHIGDDSLRQAEEAMCNLMKSVPSYQPRPDDPPPLIKLYETVKAKCQPGSSGNELVLGYGLALPISPERLWNRYRAGLNVGAGLSFRINSHWAIGGEIAYSRLSQKIESSASSIKHGDGVSLIEIIVVAKYHFTGIRGSTQFYILGGAGTNFVKFSAVTERLFSGVASPPSNAEERQTGAMAAAGMGLKFAINARAALFVESRFSLIFVAKDDLIYIPLKTGIVF
jgi:opacity protein-like surface antigen